MPFVVDASVTMCWLVKDEHNPRADAAFVRIDAAYLELALRTGLPLATLDSELVDAATAESVPLIGAAT